MLTDNLFSQVALLFAVGERQKYKAVVKALPQLIENSKFDEIGKLLVSCGSFQVANNFKDIISFFRGNHDKISKIVEIGTFNFASSTLINLLKPEEAIFYGFDNWELGGTKAKLIAEWRCRSFPNSHVITGHPLSSSIDIRNLDNTNMLLIDGHHSFRSTLKDSKCFSFLTDGATIFFHDCGLGNRIWGCFWAYYVLQKYNVITPYDGRFENYIARVDAREKPNVKPGEKPEIEFAIGKFRKDEFVKRERLLCDPAFLWQEVCERFEIRPGLDINSQSQTWDELFSDRI